LKRRGLGLAAISYDSVAVLKHFADRKAISFPLLSDQSSSVIRTLGLLNEQVPKGSEFYGVPHPVTYIIDEKGVIRSRVFEEDYRRRFTLGNVLDRRSNASTVPAKRAKLTQSASDTVLHGGQRVKLRVDIELPRGSHVYAPGVQGYIPIEWKLSETPSLELLPLKYPASKTMHLKAIAETVPVYEGKLTLEREIIPGQRLPAGEVRVEGSLRYQVCDDRQCYLPETVPLVWTFRYEPHDSTRVPPELRRKAR
jgi:hypothetical protein